MSFRPGLFANVQNVFRSSHSPFHTASRAFRQPRAVSIPYPAGRRLAPFFFPLALGAGYVAYNAQTTPVKCQSATLSNLSGRPTPSVGDGNPAPQSSLSGYQLGFGAVCGICAGVFVKKGLKALAFVLGGVFVLMQYLSTKKFISVDWGKVAGSYDSAFGTKTPKGEIRAPTVGGVWDWFVDFVTANFQQRATFLAGFALGIRLG